MTVSIRRLKYVLAATSILTPLWALSASAQVEEIIVTAQKRAEKLQEVPIAVTALNSEALDSRGIATAADLSAIAPNLTVTSTSAGAGDMALSMRGLPAADTLLSNDNPVGLYIDGVLQARLAGTVLDLVDLQRVEILRGPQGTLYGRNTTGGAVNLITKRPAEEFHIQQKLGYVDNNGEPGFVSRTSVDTGKLGNTGLKANVAFLYKKVGGYYNNTLQPDDKDPGSENVRAFRGELAFDQGGKFRANYSIYYIAQENGNTAPQLVAVGPGLSQALVPGSYTLGGGRLETLSLDKQSTDDLEMYLHNFTWEYQLTDDLTFKSITGYRHYDDLVHGPDLDGNGSTGPVAHAIVSFFPFATADIPVNLFAAQNKRQHEQFTQEVQLIGEVGKRVKYVIGGYYFLEHASERNPQSFFVPGPIPAFGIPAGLGIISGNNFAFNTSTESWAAFGQTSYTPPILDDKLTFTLGLRYSADVKFTELLSSTSLLPPVGLATAASRQASFNNLSYAATIDYKWTSNVLTYVKYSTGYKAGGFNTRSPALEPYQEETIEAYEGGLKADWFNRHLQTNLSIFYNKARNQQVAQFVAGAGGATNVITNAGKSHYQGVEFEVIAVPVEGITFNMNLGYIDPQYDQYNTIDPGSGLPVDVHANADFGYTSEVTASAGLQYDSQPMAWIGGGKFSGRVDVLYQSFQTWHPAIVYPSGARDNPLIDLVKGDARTVVNGRIALQEIPLGSTAATMEIALWGKNILDEAYVAQGIEFGALGFGQVVYGPPRTGGLDVTFKY